MVYEKGDKETKDDLVRNLVLSFTGEKTRTLTGNVSAETELFEPGALPTGDGSISTYKDVSLLSTHLVLLYLLAVLTDTFGTDYVPCFRSG